MKASAALRTASSGGWLEGFRSTFTGGLPLFRPDPRRPWTGFPLGRPHAWPRSGSSGGPRGLPPRCVGGGVQPLFPPRVAGSRPPVARQRRDIAPRAPRSGRGTLNCHLPATGRNFHFGADRQIVVSGGKKQIPHLFFIFFSLPYYPAGAGRGAFPWPNLRFVSPPRAARLKGAIPRGS